MKEQMIVMELELDCNPTGTHGELELNPNTTYYFDIPRIDLRQYACIRVKIMIADKKPTD